MGMGAYDEDEHERRVAKTAVEVDHDDDREAYRGTVEFEAGDSAEEMLDQFEEITTRSR